jgi:hypothetical protein
VKPSWLAMDSSAYAKLVMRGRTSAGMLGQPVAVSTACTNDANVGFASRLKIRLSRSARYWVMFWLSGGQRDFSKLPWQVQGDVWAEDTHALTAPRTRRQAAETVRKCMMADASEQLKLEGLEHGRRRDEGQGVGEREQSWKKEGGRRARLMGAAAEGEPPFWDVAYPLQGDESS